MQNTDKKKKKKKRKRKKLSYLANKECSNIQKKINEIKSNDILTTHLSYLDIAMHSINKQNKSSNITPPPPNGCYFKYNTKKKKKIKKSVFVDQIS
jgi:hypothetical protein